MRFIADEGRLRVTATKVKRGHGPFWRGICGHVVLEASVFNVATRSTSSNK
jgi:hypothetical protein